MKKQRYETANDVEKDIKRSGRQWRNGQGKTRELDLDPRTFSTLRWQEGEKFSPARSAYFEGVLRVFGIIVVLIMFVGAFAGVFYLAALAAT